MQPRLDQPGRPSCRPAPAARGAIDWDRLRRAPSARRSRSWTGSSTSTSTRPSRPRRVQRALAAGRARRDGPAGRVLQAAAALRLARGAGPVDADRRGDLLAAYEASAELAEQRGPHPAYAADPGGAAACCTWTTGGRRAHPSRRAGRRCARTIAAHGLRNSLLIAIAPTATIASIAGCYECIEPQVSNLFKRETLSGEFLQVNRYLVRRAEGARPVDAADPRTRSSEPRARSQGIAGIPAELRALYRTAWEMPQRALIDMAAARAPVHRPGAVAEPVHGSADDRQALLDVRLRLEAGLKTTYYLRSRPATRIAQTTVATAPAAAMPARRGAGLLARDRRGRDRLLTENPESCEACQ